MFSVGWYESDVLANQPDPICPEFFAAQAAEYKSFLTQSYDDGYNKQWSNWIQGSYVQLPTTNEVRFNEPYISVQNKF